jgi:hypothetical protein
MKSQRSYWRGRKSRLKRGFKSKELTQQLGPKIQLTLRITQRSCKASRKPGRDWPVLSPLSPSSPRSPRRVSKWLRVREQARR